jgi:hypothetical protein
MHKKFWEVEGRWFMGRVMPGELLEGIGRYLRLATPEQQDELLATIKTRAQEISEADKDMPVDGQSEGFLAITSPILAAYEVLLPIFDDEERTILFLRHVVGGLLRRPYEVAFEALGKREDPLDAIEKACRKEAPMYGDYFRIAFEPQNAETFEMRAERCFFLDFFARHGNPLLTTSLCVGRQLDASRGSGGRRTPRRANLADIAGGRCLPFPSGRHRRSVGQLFGQA